MPEKENVIFWDVPGIMKHSQEGIVLMMKYISTVTDPETQDGNKPLNEKDIDLLFKVEVMKMLFGIQFLLLQNQIMMAEREARRVMPIGRKIN